MKDRKLRKFSGCYLGPLLLIKFDFWLPLLCLLTNGVKLISIRSIRKHESSKWLVFQKTFLPWRSCISFLSSLFSYSTIRLLSWVLNKVFFQFVLLFSKQTFLLHCSIIFLTKYFYLSILLQLGSQMGPLFDIMCCILRMPGVATHRSLLVNLWK